MLRVVLLAVLFLVLVRILSRVLGAVIEGARGGGGQAQQSSAVKLARDPVCGTYVTPRTALSLHAGTSTYYFCSEECRGKFRKSGQ